MNLLARAILIGGFATLILDLWNILLNRLFGFGVPNWSVAGRWVVSVLSGRPYRPDIGSAPAIAGENAIGWVFHYVVGISFALAMLLIWPTWANAPTFWPPMIVGWVTIGCGWFIMAPLMGGGIAHSAKADPMTPRLLNMAAHTVFGLAMWVAGRVLA